jgi:hypothetical protein
MSNFNPYDIVKKANAIPQSLQEEMEDDSNTSLDSSQATDGREPLLDAYIDNRLRSNKPITFLSFIDDLRRLWEAAGKPGKFVRNMPLKDDAVFPAITYRIIRREINSSFKDLKPRFRGTIRHPYMDGEYIELYGQIFDVWVEFCIYSKSAEEADELTIELEEFLQTYAGFFKQSGVQEILFHAQGEDEVLEEARLGIAKRKLLYTMRFEKIIVRFLNEIQQIAVQANLRKEGEIN